MEKDNIKKISSNPGVYVFKDKSGKILYIGKATNLKNRVSSYFRTDANLRMNSNLRTARPIEFVIDQISRVETIETESVLEALILESNLIKKHQPKYNVDLKDDKSFSYAVITKENFPRVLILRKTELNGNKNITKYLFGPYISKKQLEMALKIIRKIFPYHSNKEQTEKGCLDFQIGLCSGPYAGAISKADYLRNIRNIRMILEGKKKNLVKKLEKEMKNCAKKHEFERAGEIRNRIFALNHIRDIALISKDIEREAWSMEHNLRIEAYDISNISGQHAVGSMVVFKNGEPEKSQYRKFKIKTIQGANDVGMMREVLKRRFNNDWPASTRGDSSSTRGWPRPGLILLDGGMGHLNMASNLLKSYKLNIPIVSVAKGPDRKNLDLRFKEENKLVRKIIGNRNLIKQAMDEAHRFAISYHKKVRGKNFTK
jgi:excinuclease ABC subunit C